MSIIPVTVPTGAIRYNTDSNKMECYNGTKWMQIAVSSPDLDGGARGLAIGGNTSPGGVNNKIDYITIPSAGNAIDFGDMVSGLFAAAGMSSRTRAVVSGGRQTPGNVSDIQYLTMSSTGNTIDWGANPLNSLSYGQGAVSNQTRGVTMGGNNTSNTHLTDIQYLTIASLGTINDFGDITTASVYVASVNSPTRGLVAGGQGASPYPIFNSIEYITIASTGNAVDFGNLRFNQTQRAGTGNRIRGIFGGGYISPTGRTTLMDQIEIATTGNATAFGDLTVTTSYAGATSDSHGGLSE